MRLNIWYRSLTPIKQLTILFLTNWIIWFMASLIGNRVFFDEKHPLIYHIFHAAWFAFIMTIAFDWKKIKSLFKSGNGHNRIE